MYTLEIEINYNDKLFLLIFFLFKQMTCLWILAFLHLSQMPSRENTVLDMLCKVRVISENYNWGYTITLWL